jgi:hypothetical protein
MPQTTEQAFASYVEEILLRRSGWQPGTVTEWDVERALFAQRIFAFLQETQQKLWSEMQALRGAGLENLLLNTLVKESRLQRHAACLATSKRPPFRFWHARSSRPSGPLLLEQKMR